MDKKQNILIAGGTGFIGRALVMYLLEKGRYRIKILTRDPEYAFEIFSNTVIILKWPGHKEMMLLPEGEQCEAVINLSGENIGDQYWTSKQKQWILKSRINAVSGLCQIIKNMKVPPKVWIQASAIGYYGFNFDEKVDESGIKGEGFLADVVDQVEQELLSNNLLSTRKVILRLGIVLSNEGGFLQKMIDIFEKGIAVTFGNGKQNLSYIHINDLVRLIEQAIVFENYNGIINAVAPNPISMSQLVSYLKKKTKAKISIVIPSFLLRVLFGSEKANELLLANQNVVSDKLKKLEFTFTESIVF